jgi:hypothetical protein
MMAPVPMRQLADMSWPELAVQLATLASDLEEVGAVLSRSDTATPDDCPGELALALIHRSVRVIG